MPTVEIQYQDISGGWRTGNVSPNMPQMILIAMNALKMRYPNARIRAVDFSGRIVDIL